MWKRWILGVLIPVMLLILAPGVGAEEPSPGLEPAAVERTVDGSDSEALTIEELGLAPGEPTAPQQMSCSGDYACSENDAICGGCPPGYSCGVGAKPASSPQSCCITGPFVCVQTCRWNASSCSSFCMC